MARRSTGGPAEGGTPAAAPGRSAVTPRRAFWASFALFFALFGLWALASPLTAAPDEPAHATKAAAVVRGQWVGDPVAGEPNGFGSVHVPKVIWESQAYPLCFYFHPEVDASCLVMPTEEPDRIVYAVTTASNYNPLYYSVTGLPSLLPVGIPMLYLMRLVSAAICAFALAWAVRSLAELRRVSWPVLGLVAALTPQTVFLASSISPAAPEICAAIGLWTGLLVVVRRPDPARLPARMAGIAVLASVLVNLRGLSPLFLAIAVVTVVVSAPWHNTWVALRDRRSWPWLGLVGVASVLALVWSRTQGTLPSGAVKFPEWGFRTAAKRSVLDTWPYLKNMVGQFGWMDTDLPIWLVVAWLAALVALLVAAVVRGSWRERLALVGLAGASLVLPIVIHASQAKYVGIVWQGRYFLPAVVGIPLLAGFVLRGRPAAVPADDVAVGGADEVAEDVPTATADATAHEPLDGLRSAGRWLPWGAGALLAAQLVAFAVNLHRYVVGTDGPWLGTADEAWMPPLSPPVLLLLAAAVLWWLYRLLRRVTPDAR